MKGRFMKKVDETKNKQLKNNGFIDAWKNAFNEIC